ncbi:MAG: VCBS repeat-containing protein [Saonia sp.]
MNRIWLFFSLLCNVLFISCHEQQKKQLHPTSAASLYQGHCGSCHLVPDPANIPKDIWEKSVLPEMAARMGYSYNGYRPNKGKSILEDYYVKLSNAYPKESVLDSVSWAKIHNYVISMAPDTIPLDTTRKNRTGQLTQFSLKPITINELKMPIITHIQFDTVTHRFNVGDVTGGILHWPPPSERVAKKFNSAVTSYEQKNKALYVTEIGILNPSEIPKGLISKRTVNTKDTIAKELQRPVFTKIVDLNQDGLHEILICEFGHHSGKLSLLEQKNLTYVKKSLLSLPGSIKLEIADMNKDGKKDIIALFSQGDEGIYIFYQKNNLEFNMEHIIRMGPEYGSSWFELLDYNGDGYLDIVYVNGDNADYSIFSKPYHGIRLFINDTSNNFVEKWFYPIYGATRVLADDYDLDGDIDFAVTAFFRDMDSAPDEGFVFLENKTSEHFDFRAYTFKGNFASSWLIMDNGDYDLDGDLDILLGAFKITSTVDNVRNTEKNALLLLENNAIKPSQ